MLHLPALPGSQPEQPRRKCEPPERPPAMAETVNFTAALEGSEEVPPVETSGVGTAEATYDTETKKLTWNITYSDLTGPATGAHFHGPALMAGAVFTSHKAIAKVRCQVERTFAILKQMVRLHPGALSQPGAQRVAAAAVVHGHEPAPRACFDRQRGESVRCPVRTGFFGRKARPQPSEDNFSRSTGLKTCSFSNISCPP